MAGTKSKVKYEQVWDYVRKPGSGGKRVGAGRPKKEQSEKGVTFSAYLSIEDREYLAKWGVGNSDQLKRMIERARQFWPKGE